MLSEEQKEGFARSASAYARGRARDGVVVSSQEIYDGLVADAEKVERARAERMESR